MKILWFVVALYVSALHLKASAEGVKELDCHLLVRNTFDPGVSDKISREVMRHVASNKASPDNVLGWFESLRLSQNQHPLTVSEHNALLFILKSQIFATPEHADVIESLKESIRMSFLHLSGSAIGEGHEFTPLPSQVLAASGNIPTLLHRAILDEKNQALPRWNKFFRNIRSRATPENVVEVLLTALTLSFEPGREAFAGLIVGLLQASLNEHLVHIGVGHASPELSKSFRKFGRVGQFLEQVTLAHKLHHIIVKKYFGAAVLPEEQIAFAERTLRKLTENLILDRMRDSHPDSTDLEIQELPLYQERVERLIAVTRKGNYGINGTFLGALSMIVSATPYHLMNYGIYMLTESEAYLVAAEVSMMVMILQSLYSHRYIHLKPEDEGITKVNRLQLWYVNKTWIGQLARQLHFVHHELPFAVERTKNGDIMAGSTTDRMKQGLQSPTVRDLLEMERQNLLEP